MESKVIVVTGASQGLGAALARQLAADGHRVVLAARRKEQLERVAAQCQDKAKVVVADVTVRADVERLRQEALAAFGQLDVWVNNAATTSGKRVLELDEAELDRVFALNVKAVLHSAQVVVPHFIERKQGHLINVGCFFGRVPLGPQRAAYNASKAALAVLTADLRMDLAVHPGITVSLVLPGPLATEALDRLPAYPGVSVQPPEEVADTIAGLVESPRAEVYSRPFLKALARRYHENVSEFEAGMASPLLSAPPLLRAPRPPEARAAEPEPAKPAEPEPAKPAEPAAAPEPPKPS